MSFWRRFSFLLPPQVKQGALFIKLVRKMHGAMRHSRPPANFEFNRPTDTYHDTFQLFADANGTFYPEKWSPPVPRTGPWKADSLLNEAARTSGFGSRLTDAEAKQLASFRAWSKGKQRVFFLVHGYNNDHEEALVAYKKIESQLAVNTDDGVVRLYWDGLVGESGGEAAVWFYAAGNSQMVGQRGLRRLLNCLDGKTVFLLGHSRAASVMLSALGNAVWNVRFLQNTKSLAQSWGMDPDQFMHPAELPETANQIHVLLAAPAVDKIDFWPASDQPKKWGRWSSENVKTLHQLRSLRYTINPKDWVLTKKFGLSRYFNPTGLGCDANVTDDLKSRVTQLKPYELANPMTDHVWTSYLETEEWQQMLADAGIAANNA